jgi:tetratricopeptide (TPR) repeat protein
MKLPEDARMRNRRLCPLPFLTVTAVCSVISVLLPGCADPATNAQQNQQLVAGYQALNQGQADTAMSDADNYLAAQPTGAGAAEALYLKGRAFEARPKLNPEQARQNLASARAAYEAALDQHPVRKTEGYIRAALSNVAFYQDDYLTALDQATHAYDLVSDNRDLSSVLLYRMGVSQQRLGRFTDADHTFDLVQMRYPLSPLADRARARQGMRQFFVQLATFDSTAGADEAIASLRGSGLNLTRAADSSNHVRLDAGPFESYQAAKDVQTRYASQYPKALTVP